MNKANYKQRIILALIGCATFGLAPFVPEPHLIGKLRWILGGAHGMTFVDWFDAFFHGIPWAFLLYFIAAAWRGRSSR